jgi:alkylresorcinol/alkylpyrone synthase
MSQIKTVATIIPEFTYDTPQIIEAADRLWLKQVDPAARRLALKVMEGAEINQRSSAYPLEVVFGDLSFREKNDLYIKKAIEMAESALKKALDQANISPDKIDYLITTSCTGFMIPSVDAYLINSLKMRQNVVRVPITEMGCAGGTSALIYAHEFTKSNPDKYVAIVSVELPSITFQKNDFSPENLVSTAIFADGASAVILGPVDGPGPVIQDTDMYHFPDTTQIMGYHLWNSGLKIILDRAVPDTIDSHFLKFFMPFLNRNGLEPQDVHHYMFHPGGKKIINRVEDFIGRFGKDISESKGVLQNHGNLSSSTILFILEKILQKKTKSGDLGYMLAFGPGFSGQSLLLKWE